MTRKRNPIATGTRQPAAINRFRSRFDFGGTGGGRGMPLGGTVPDGVTPAGTGGGFGF
jgi:hypothetical protein